MSLIDFFEQQIAQFGPQPALVMQSRYRTLRWSYEELGEKTKILAQALADKGITVNDRVLLYSANSPFWVAAFFAILSRGAIVVPLNPQSLPEQLALIVSKAKPKLLLKSVRLSWEANKLPSLEIEAIDEKTSKDQGEIPQRPILSKENLAEIVFTSGTTGDPKGVMLTHGNLLYDFNAISKAIPIKPLSQFINIVPLFHLYGQMIGMFYPLGHGAAITYLPSLGTSVIRETLASTPATHLIAVPEFLKTALSRLEIKLKEKHMGGILENPILRKLPPSVCRLMLAPIRKKISKTLHTIASGGAPLDPELEKKWRVLGFYLQQGYGLTETGPVISINTYRDHRLGSVGKPLPGVQVRLSPKGEVQVKGPIVTRGYYQDEKKTEEAFESGWFKTNDGGTIDKDGFLTVFGRIKYMILGGGGENIFPEDIEAELNKIEAVRDSAVVGLERNGRTLIHAILLSDSENGDSIVKEANLHLAPHQQIVEWSLWPQADFPRSATRKIKKEEVLKWLKSRKVEKPVSPTASVTPLTRLLGEITEHDPRVLHAETRIVPELQLDSLLRIELVSRLEEDLDVLIEERQITPKTTVAELESLIVEKKGKPQAGVPFPYWELSAPARMLRPFLQHILFFSWLRYYAKLRLEGLENLRELKEPVLFMPNHKSYLDSVVALRAIPPRFRRRLGIAAAIDVLYEHHKWFAPAADLIFNAYPFATHTDENLKPSLKYTGRLIDQRWNILIYPEGLMNRTDQPLLPLKGGTGLLAVEMQVPVVPMAIHGSEKIIPPGKNWPQCRGEIAVCFGKPLYFKQTDAYPFVTREVEKSLLQLVQSTKPSTT